MIGVIALFTTLLTVAGFAGKSAMKIPKKIPKSSIAPKNIQSKTPTPIVKPKPKVIEKFGKIPIVTATVGGTLAYYLKGAVDFVDENKPVFFVGSALVIGGYLLFKIKGK